MEKITLIFFAWLFGGAGFFIFYIAYKLLEEAVAIK